MNKAFPALIERRVRSRRASDIVDPKFKFAYFFSNNNVEVSILLVIANILIGTGFLFGPVINSDYAILYAIDPAIWAAYFFIYASIRAAGVAYLLHPVILIATSIVSLWAWNYLFLMLAVFDYSAITPSEMLLMLPVLLESWLMMTVICRKHKEAK